MRIGIDARLYGNKHTGIGRYTKNLLLSLARLKTKHNFFVFGGDDLLADTKNFKNFHFVRYTSRVYTLAEQIYGPILFLKHKLDLLHIPHFNAPILYPRSIILTVHDLIKHDSTGPSTTTLPAYQYHLKKFVYQLAILTNIKKAKHIITPSHYWKKEISRRYKLSSNKISVIYEAVDKKIHLSNTTPAEKLLRSYGLTKPFIIYTGNLYPHKNIDFLIRSLNKFNASHEHNLTLGIISARNNFKKQYATTKNIRLLGFVPDKDISTLYSQALALVQPSLIEGFGLTGLEAMSCKTPVLSSNATCLPEIYSHSALYFDPHREEELIFLLQEIISKPHLRRKLIKSGVAHAKRFSWYKTAKETLKIYETCLSLR